MSPQERWTTFLAKVSARADEIVAEADAGFDELIAVQVLDGQPLSAAMSEFHSRMLGLGRKIDDAWQKIDAELDAPSERSALVEQGRAATAAIDRKSKVLQVTKAAKAAEAVRGGMSRRQPSSPRRSSARSNGSSIAPRPATEVRNVRGAVVVRKRFNQAQREA